MPASLWAMRAPRADSLPVEELARGRVNAALGDRDPVQGAVELAVPATVEPVALAVARGGRDRGDAGSRASFASEGKRPTPAVSATSLAAVSGPQPGSASSSGT
jgi:hypothetical protein